ncbi:MAG: transcription repressor NadR [Oscillospiraceae bacterium]|nr:transcription repressor NadR [Oscillospiraceae bacterium]
MDADLRREQILNIINREEAPVSASSLAKTLSVSRQVIVGDVALLRAQGHEILATARGYMISKFKEANQYLGKVACCHKPENTKSELYTIVDLEAIVVNTIVEHNIYGEITGSLNLNGRADVDAFMNQVESSKVKLLSELTMGLHLHTIACRDKSHFEQVCRSLEANGYLYQN